MNIANTLTIIRILLTPVFGYFLYYAQWTNALIVLGIATITDILDGYLARKLNQETRFGKALDPAADKIFFATAIIVLIFGHDLPLYYFLLLTRDIIVGIGGIAALLFSKQRKKLYFSATYLGKAVTGFQILGVVLIILQIMGKTPETYTSVCVLLTLILGITNTLQYAHRYMKGKVIREEE